MCFCGANNGRFVRFASALRNPVQYYDQTGGTYVQTTYAELNQRFIAVKMRAVENNRGWKGEDG